MNQKKVLTDVDEALVWLELCHSSSSSTQQQVSQTRSLSTCNRTTNSPTLKLTHSPAQTAILFTISPSH